MEQQGKVCTKCGVWKPLEEFNKQKGCKLGVRPSCRECDKKVKREYYANNKELHSERCKKYREENKEKVDAKRREYYYNNREEISKQRKEKYKENKEEILKQQKEYYERNKEAVKEYSKRYYQENKERINLRNKIYNENNKEKLAIAKKKWYEENKEDILKYHKEYHTRNKERKAEYDREYRARNKEHKREIDKKYRDAHKEEIKIKKSEYAKNNRDKINEYCRRKDKINKQKNIQNITEMLEQLNPALEGLNLNAYGYIYKVSNIKTGHVYIGQSTMPFKRRYSGGIKGWIKERKEKANQQFIEELTNEEDFEVEEVFDIGICKWHLDKLESFYIDKFNSYDNGYNNNAGHHDTDEGIEEFENILKEYNLEFIDNELRKIND